MRLEIIGKTVVKDFTEFVEKFHGVEDWLKKNLQIDHIHWDEDKNAELIVQQYLNERQGMFTVMKNDQTGSMMILELLPPTFLVTGAGEDMKAKYGDKLSVERAFFDYVRKNYNSDIENYDQAMKYLKEHGDEENPVRIF